MWNCSASWKASSLGSAKRSATRSSGSVLALRLDADELKRELKSKEGGKGGDAPRGSQNNSPNSIRITSDPLENRKGEGERFSGSGLSDSDAVST